MKPRPFRNYPFGLKPSLIAALPVGIMLAVSSSAFATSDAWDGSTSNVWSVNTNWLTDPATVPGTTETATFNNAGNGNTTIDLGAGVTIGQVVFDTAAAASYTIGSGAVGSQTLTLGTVGGNTIQLASTVAANQLFNSNLALATTGTYKLQNNSTTNSLTVAGGISTTSAGIKVLNVDGVGNTALSGAITSGTGTVNLLKTGAGTLTLSGGGAFSGNGVNANLGGAAANVPVVLREGITRITSGAYTVTGEAVVGGNVTAGGAGTNTSLILDGGSLTTSAFLSVARGNGVGGVSSDLVLNNAATITAANFGGGFNAGSALNLPKGTATLNNTSSLTVSGNGTINLAESAGSDFAFTLNNSSQLIAAGTGSKNIANNGTGSLTLNGTSSVTFGNGTVNVGGTSANNANVITNAVGTLTVNTGTTFTANNEIRIAAANNVASTVSGTVNVAGGTLTANALTFVRSNANVATSLTGALNVTNNGIVNVATGATFVGWQGGGSTGTINVSSGTFNQSTTTTNNIELGVNGSVSGAINLSGTGVLNLQRNSNIRFSTTATSSGTNSLNISGTSSVNFYSDGGVTSGGTGVIDLMFAAGTATNTINLNGGTLTANQIKATSATGTRVINFNGGTLKAGATGLASTFLASGVATTANVRNGGAKLDSNGLNVTIGQALNHSAIGGDNATDGGLTKSGAGSLTLTAVNTYNGATVVNQGTLALGATASLASTSLNVANGATFSTAAQASYSLASLASGITMNLDASTGGFVDGGAGAYTLGNALTLNFSTNALVLNQAYNLFDYASQTGDFASVSLTGALSGTLTRSGEVWTGTAGGNGFSFDETSGILTVVAVPEPTVALLGALGAFTLLRRRRVAA